MRASRRRRKSKNTVAPTLPRPLDTRKMEEQQAHSHRRNSDDRHRGSYDRARGAAVRRPCRSPGAGRPPPLDEQPERAAPAVWSDPDLRSMRWAVLVSFLLGAYAAAFVVVGASLTP